jgi:Ca2+-binding RTX toxin-like protein
LAVAAMLKDPTPQNIVGATQQVTGMLGAMNGSASLQNLSYSLGNATAVFSVYNFAKNPSKQTAVSAMLSVAMRMPSLAPYAVPLAAALTIGELVIPGFTDKAVNALVHDIPGVAFDVTKNVIKVEVSLLKGALNLAGSVVETVGGVVNSVGNVVANTVTSVVNTVINVAKKVWRRITPLVVNLADDPVHTTTLTATSPLFDMSGDGVKERTGWITADEGFLVRDLNGNGKIDSINEMFSERTSTTANSAFGALAELDSNKDGVISNTDANWSTLKVWVDKNSDGTTQANELYTLAQLGIASIKLNPTKNFAYDNGNVIGDKSTFTYTDGRVGEIADAIFTTQDASITQNVSQTLITQDSTTVRLSNGQTMKVLDVHGKTLTVGSATEGINIVTSTGGNTVTAADDANGLVLMGETGDTLNAGKGHLVTLVSNGGAKLVGNTEDNLYVVSQTSDVIVEAVNAGVDTVRSSASYTLSANLENLTLTGTTAISGTGNALNNTMTGNSANNVLDGGAGIDTLVGGSGNDTYVVDMSTDVIIESASEGVDKVQSSVSYSLANVNNVENLTLTGSIGINGTGNALANTLIGNSASNVLDGGAGNDILNGGVGGDTLKGGLGDDTYVVDSTTDSLIENANEGTDTVQASVSHILGANLENLTLTGVAAIDGRGNALNNYIVGNTANNFLYGNDGADWLDGGAGNDYLYGASGYDTYVFGRGSGQDYVYDYDWSSSAASSIDVVQLGAGIGASDVVVTRDTYNLYLSIAGTTDKLTLNYWFSGDSYRVEQVRFADGTVWDANTLIAKANVGTTGNDYLVGSTGADRLAGLVGNDNYLVDNAGDVVVENANEGYDTVNASVSYTLAANVESLYLQGSNAINATGNELSNILNGNRAANVLDGGAGNDYLYGAYGNDTYVFGRGSGQDKVSDYDSTVGNVDVVQIGAGIGASDVVVTRDTYNLYLSIAGTTDKLTLNYWFSGDSYRVEQVKFADGTVWNANTLVAKTNVGTSGADYLAGTTGADRLAGLAGNDTYVVDNAGDVVVENANEGYDTVNASVSYTLAANVESLTLTGTAAINATGNELSNTLYGNSAANTLDGGSGNDYLYGASGNDTYVFSRGSGQDTVFDYDSTVGNVDIVQLGAGIGASDVVVTRDTYNLYLSIAGTTDKLTLSNWFSGDAYRIEQVRFADGAVWDANTLVAKTNVGTSGADYLAGTTGADRLAGLAGNDTYVVDNAGDVVIENANEGADTVTASVSYTLAANVENLYLQGSNAINATGNELSNILNCNSAANTLDGGSGNDFLYGYGGNDTYVFSRGSGQDYVLDYDSTFGNVDIVQLGASIGVSDVLVTRDQSSLYLSIAGTTDKLMLSNWFSGDSYRIEQVRFADGTVWDANTLFAKTNLGTSGADYLAGTAGADRLVGLAGNDTYVVDYAGDVVVENANEGYDTVNASVSYMLAANVETLYLQGSNAINATGNESSNVLYGNRAANVLDGETGNDVLIGGGGGDTYIFGRGYGIDNVYDYDTTVGNVDTVQLGAGIASDQLWFKHVGNDLEISIIGSTDKATIQNWYSGSQNQVEQIKVAGKTLLNTDVEKLVQAMASFAAPASGQTTLPTNYQTTLAPVIAANWH